MCAMSKKDTRELVTIVSILLIIGPLMTVLSIPDHDNNVRIGIPSPTRASDTRAASVPTLDVSMSWTYDYEYENDQGTTFQGTETQAVEAIQDLNLGGFEYEAYRISLSGHGTLDSGDYTGSIDFSGYYFLRTADLALIKTEKETTTQIDNPSITRKEDVVETYQPPRMDFKFPLEKGKWWEFDTHYTRHTTTTTDDNPDIEMDEEDLSFIFRVREEENINISLGTFFTYSVWRSDKNNVQNYTSYWYSPEVSYIVKEEEWESEGVRAPVLKGERELTRWAHNEPPLLTTPMDDLTMQEDIPDETIDLLLL